MGACDIRYQLITPDGWTLDFEGPRFSWGTADSLMAHEGFGLPPVEHVTQDIYGMPGALLQDTLVKPRAVTITTTTHGLTRRQLHRARAKLNEAMRWDRGAKAEPSILRYWVNGTARDLYVHYAGDVTRSVGRYGQVEVIGFRLAAYDPMFYEPLTEEQVLDWQNELNVLYIAARLGGLWDNLGPPAAVAAGPKGGRIVYAIAEDRNTGNIYIGGDFDNWDNLGIGVGKCIAMWDGATWNAVGGGLNDIVLGLQFAPDGTLLVCGEFTNGGGGVGPAQQSKIARYNPPTNTYTDVGGGPGAGAVTAVYDAVIGHNGTIYVGGIFTNWAGLGSPAGDYIVRWTGTTWAALGTGLNSSVYEMAVAANGNIWVVGGFTQTGGGAAIKRVAEWDVEAAAWSQPLGGVDQPARGIKIAADGTVYVCGLFTLANPGPDQVTVNYVARWNGTAWSSLAGGLNNAAYYIVIDGGGTVYISGQFTQAGPLTVADRIAKWNGFSWAHLDIDLPGTPLARAMLISAQDELYIGFDTQGTAYTAGGIPIVNEGNAASYPVIEIKNAGLVQYIRNETIGKDTPMDMQMLDGEIVTIDLSPGVKTVTSNWRGNRLGDVLPNSDLAEFALECHPRAQHGGIEGANLITVFITDAIPRETGDNNNQLSGWENITGISQHNTDLGRLYVSILDEGGGFYHIEFFKDRAKAAEDRVANTVGYMGPGVENVIELNNSGLGGTIMIDAVVGADTDIEVVYTIATIFWRNRWWDIDNAVS